MEKRKMEHLKKAVKSCVEDDFEFKAKRIQIKPDYDHDGDAIWLINVLLDDGKKKIQKGDTFHLEGAIGRAVWREQKGDHWARAPIIMTRYSKKKAAAA